MVEDYETDLPDRHRFHYLREPRGSFVLISPNEDVPTAIVFVHGFNGDSLGTWARFELLIDDHPTLKESYAGADLFFLQYNSVWNSINASVGLFDRFINTVVMTKDRKAFEVDVGRSTVAIPRLDPHNYRGGREVCRTPLAGRTHARVYVSAVAHPLVRVGNDAIEDRSHEGNEALARDM